MKDNYVGDIGDYAKLILLRNLSQIKGIKLGINWYFNKAEEQNTDGLHIDYLCFDKKNVEDFDPNLYDQLRKIVENDYRYRKGRPNGEKRRISDLTNILGKDIKADFKEEVPSSKKSRPNWIDTSLIELKECNLIFLDPDNSIAYNDANGNKKHVLRKEIEHYWKHGKSLVIYDHRDRKPKEQYDAKFKIGDLKPSCFIEANMHSKRTYVFYLQSHHKEVVQLLKKLCHNPDNLGQLFSNFRK
jgi:hypothetical protein